MKKIYTTPQTTVINFAPESMMAVSVGGFTDDESWTNKKEPSTIWGTEEEDEKGGIW